MGNKNRKSHWLHYASHPKLNAVIKKIWQCIIRRVIKLSSGCAVEFMWRVKPLVCPCESVWHKHNLLFIVTVTSWTIVLSYLPDAAICCPLIALTWAGPSIEMSYLMLKLLRVQAEAVLSPQSELWRGCRSSRDLSVYCTFWERREECVWMARFRFWSQPQGKSSHIGASFCLYLRNRQLLWGCSFTQNWKCRLHFADSLVICCVIIDLQVLSSRFYFSNLTLFPECATAFLYFKKTNSLWCEYKEIHYLYFTFIHLNIVQ